MQKDLLTKRINRISGQVRGIQRMLDEERDCTEVITQIQATRAALAALGEEVVCNEANICVNEEAPERQVKKLQTLIKDLFKLS